MTEPCSQHPYSRARAYELKQRREKANHTLVLRVYFCPECGKYHLTSKPDRFKREEAS